MVQWVIWFKLDDKPHKTNHIFSWLGAHFPNPLCMITLAPTTQKTPERKKFHVDIPLVDEIGGASKPQMLFTVSWNSCSL